MSKTEQRRWEDIAPPIAVDVTSIPREVRDAFRNAAAITLRAEWAEFGPVEISRPWIDALVTEWNAGSNLIRVEVAKQSDGMSRVKVIRATTSRKRYAVLNTATRTIAFT